jgi:hypothetical protein
MTPEIPSKFVLEAKKRCICRDKKLRGPFLGILLSAIDFALGFGHQHANSM